MKECSKCKSSEYTNKTLVMLINECAHPLCKNCVENLYARNAAPCHICGRTLRKNTFWEQVFDDPHIEKENNIRKRLKKIYNLKEDDFQTLREFNDYLEMVENIVWSLANDYDVENTDASINEFKEQNAELIEKNRKRLDADQLWVLDQLREESEAKKKAAVVLADHRAATAKANTAIDTKALMDELRDSNAPAEIILDRERKRQIEAEMEKKEREEEKKRRAKEISASRKRPADQISFSNVGQMRDSDHRAWTYVPPILLINGPPLPDYDCLEDLGYLQYMRAAKNDALAGGYEAGIGAFRALFESRVDLLDF